MDRVRRIGYRRSDRRPELPDPIDFVDSGSTEEVLDPVSRYLAAGTVAAACTGLSKCRICGDHVGSRQFTDGLYRWPESLAHYVRHHHVRLPTEFEQHAEDMLDRAERQLVDDGWWQRAMRR